MRNVVRRGNLAVHILDKNSSTDLKEKEEVHQFINWQRRFDHMQQHSGQHLITALFEREFDNKTKGKKFHCSDNSLSQLLHHSSLVARC